MTDAKIDIRFVDIRQKYQIVDALLTLPTGVTHRIGHLPTGGWFCSCLRAKRCPHLRTLQDLIPGIAPPTTAAPPPPPATPAPDGVPRE